METSNSLRALVNYPIDAVVCLSKEMYASLRLNLIFPLLRFQNNQFWHRWQGQFLMREQIQDRNSRIELSAKAFSV